MGDLFTDMHIQSELGCDLEDVFIGDSCLSYGYGGDVIIIGSDLQYAA